MLPLDDNKSVHNKPRSLQRTLVHAIRNVGKWNLIVLALFAIITLVFILKRTVFAPKTQHCFIIVSRSNLNKQEEQVLTHLRCVAKLAHKALPQVQTKESVILYSGAKPASTSVAYPARIVDILSRDGAIVLEHVQCDPAMLQIIGDAQQFVAALRELHVAVSYFEYCIDSVKELVERNVKSFALH